MKVTKCPRVDTLPAARLGDYRPRSSAQKKATKSQKKLRKQQEKQWQALQFQLRREGLSVNGLRGNV